MNQTTTKPESTECTTNKCLSQESPSPALKVAPQWKLADDGETATLKIALPGVTRESVRISHSAQEVVVAAPRPETNQEPAEYELKLRLARDLDPSSAQAKLGNGVLTLEFARKEEAKPRTIPVSD